MVFDLIGDASYGYLAAVDGAAVAQERALDEVGRHVQQRLAAPWPRFVEELQRTGMPHLARVVAETIAVALRRPGLSDLREELARLFSWMTEAQVERFDLDSYVGDLPLHRVLTLLRYGRERKEVTVGEQQSPVRREQHPTGGDLRSLLRRRLDPVWLQAMAAMPATDTLEFLASWPVEPAWMAGQPGEHDFAVAYALATDAPVPGRRWSAPAPYVFEDEREDFEHLAGRGPEAVSVRRATRLGRWGASAVFPQSMRWVDAGLETASGLTDLHAGGSWRTALAASADLLDLARRRFLQQVADDVGEAEVAW